MATLLFGQSQPSNSRSAITGTTVKSIDFNDPSAGTVAWVSRDGSLNYFSANLATAPRETRKDDGKGPSAAQVDASAVLLAKAKLPSTRYRDLATAIGLDPSPISDEIDVLQAISDLGMRVYDWGQVDGYLFRQALKQGASMRWVWKPLRESDLKAIGGLAWTSPDRVGFLYSQQYRHAIPENVLERAAAFVGKVPRAVLLVSDYEVINPDPFLAVTTEHLLRAGKIWVVERWDEPGFEALASARK
jgi:hypothetical protein